MNLRPAAALALVGWYLMTPPIDWTGKRSYPDDRAPLSKWEMAGSFDPAEACQHKRDDEIYHPCTLDIPASSVCPQNAIPRDDDFWRAERESFFEARCIGTDDPRLKEK